MPPVADPPAVRGFALTDFTNIPNPPPDDGPAADLNAGKQTDTGKVAGTIEEPPIKPLVDDEPEKKPDDKPGAGKNPDEDAPESLETAMRRAPDKKAEEDKVAAEKKKQDEAAAEAEKAKAGGKPDDKPAADRDADLKNEAEHAHVHPKTRKIITDIKAKTKAARDERDAIVKERDALKAERDQLAEKAKAAPVSKEVEEEVKVLRERVRELDISKDPIIEAKYDRKIAANNQAIVTTLKGQGYGMVEKDGKMVEDPKVVADLLKNGLTFKALSPLIKKLEEAELIDEAEAIRESIRQNNRLAAERTQEIEGWKADHGKRQQVREAQTKQQVEQQQAAYTQQTDVQYRAELAALEKDLPYLRQPAAPLATDTPAVAKAKQTALDEYTAAAKKIETEVRLLNPEGAPPEKQPEIIGRINANAILAITLKAHVLPKAIREIQAGQARIKELETELAKIRDAGKLSKLQAGAGSTDPNAGKETPASLEEAMKAAVPGGRQG